MKKIKYIAFTLVALTAAAFATVYSDDFESYPVGYDIADSADWTDEFCNFGSIMVEENSTNKYVTGISQGYGYVPAGEVINSNISFDFRFTGDNMYVNAHFRLNDTEHRGYIVSCCNELDGVYGLGDYVMVGYGSYVWHSPNIYLLGNCFDVGTWYHLDALLWGYPDVNYNVTVNEDINYAGTLDYYQTETGFSGISVCSSYIEDAFIDNFEVDDNPVITGIKSASLGEIKASFR